jgi:hypothetical protein
MPTITLKWDARARRFRGESGRFVRREAVTAALERVREEGRKRVTKHAEDLKAGRINLPEWIIRMKSDIKSQHLLSAGIAQGGKAQLSPAALGRIGAQVRVQYGYLQAYARQIANGQKPVQASRSALYINASRQTFSEAERRMQRDAGVKFERNELNASESCEECRAEANKGVVPIGTLTPIGSRICKSNCLCRISYTNRGAA